MQFQPAVPVLRILSVEQARAFYLDHLGFRWDWEQRAGPHAALYAQISRADLVLHLSEHPDDASPGAMVFVAVNGLAAWHAELRARPSAYPLPDLLAAGGGQELVLTDPFGNRLRFGERAIAAPPPALTRAQVRAEFLKARADGTLPPTGEVG